MKLDKKFLKFIGKYTDSSETFVPDLTTKRLKIWTDSNSLDW